MSRFLSLLVVLLFCFDLSLVAARLPSLHHRSPTPVDVAGLNTNAKRFGRGLPPLPPLIRRKPTGADTARRSLTSQCAKSGVIKVISPSNNAALGFLSLTSTNGALTSNPAKAAVFSSTVNTSGKTIGINILHVTNGNHYLAGLIKKNQPLGNGSGNVDNIAILGLSFATNPGESPQADKDPNWIDRDAETAIWTYDRADDSLTATWVNYPGQTPSSTPAYIYGHSTQNKIFLANSPTTAQGGYRMLFRFVSTAGDQCSS